MPIRLDSRDPAFAQDFETLLGCKREVSEEVGATVAAILADVRARGDAAVIELHRTSSTAARVTARRPCVSPRTRSTPPPPASPPRCARRCSSRMTASAPTTKSRSRSITSIRIISASPSARVWTAVEAVGIYVPGGLAAYPSSVLMNAVPAKVAGVDAHRHGRCRRPAARSNDAVLAAAKIAGVTEIYRVGGAQAVARARLWHRDHCRRSTRSSAPAMPMSPPPSGRSSARSAST